MGAMVTTSMHVTRAPRPKAQYSKKLCVSKVDGFNTTVNTAKLTLIFLYSKDLISRTVSVTLSSTSSPSAILTTSTGNGR